MFTVFSRFFILVTFQGDAPQLSALQKKLHPERQALTQEELKVLVDHDDLAKRVSALLDTDRESAGAWVLVCSRARACESRVVVTIVIVEPPPPAIPAKTT